MATPVTAAQVTPPAMPPSRQTTSRIWPSHTSATEATQSAGQAQENACYQLRAVELAASVPLAEAATGGSWPAEMRWPQRDVQREVVTECSFQRQRGEGTTGDNGGNGEEVCSVASVRSCSSLLILVVDNIEIGDAAFRALLSNSG
jgi:hypothetical protein